jgi:hypothetical protein
LASSVEVVSTALFHYWNKNPVCAVFVKHWHDNLELLTRVAIALLSTSCGQCVIQMQAGLSPSD